MPERIVARPFFRPSSVELRYLPECPRMVDGKLAWVSIQYGPEAKDGGINFLDLAARTNVHHHLPGRPRAGAVIEGPRFTSKRPCAMREV